MRSSFAEALEVDAGEIDLEVPLGQLPNMESVRFLRAVAALEESSGLLINDGVLYQVTCLAELVDLLVAQGSAEDPQR